MELGRGEFYWHEVVGVAVRGIDGAELGTVRDIYRVGENEVYVVGGGTVRRRSTCRRSAPFIRIFAPRRGEIVVDADALDLAPAEVEGARPRPAEGASTAHRGARPTTAAPGDAGGPPPPCTPPQPRPTRPRPPQP